VKKSHISTTFALRVLDVERAIAALVLDRTAGIEAGVGQAPPDALHLLGLGVEGGVDVGPAFVPELLLARPPKTEASPRPGGEPDPILLVLKHLEPEIIGIERGQGFGISRLQGQLAERADTHGLSPSCHRVAIRCLIGPAYPNKALEKPIQLVELVQPLE
jgi:hypothetical protein